MATLQGKAVKNTYRQVLQIGANNVGVSGSLQPVQDGAGVNTALSLSTAAATINGNLTITGDLIITGGGIEIKELIDDTVAALIQNGTGITWTYNDGANTLTGNFTGTTSVVPEGSNLYYTQGRFDSAFAAKSTTNLAEGANLYFTNARARTALSVTGGTGIAYDNATGVFNLAAIPNASLANSSITINGQAVSLGGTVTLTTTNIAEGTNLYYTQARFDTAFSNKSTTNLAEGSNLYYTQARFDTALAAKTTTDLAEGSNLYYTDTRARLALSSSATGLSYANNSGVFSLTAGYAIPTNVKLGQYDTAYNRSIVSAAVSGTGTKTLSLTQQDANVVSATWTDLGITTINGTANQILATTAGNTTTIAFTNDVTMPNNLVVSGNLTINGTATYVNTQSISAKDPLFEVANDNNTTDAVDIGYYGRYYDTPQTRVEFTGLFRDASDAGKFKFFTGLVDEPTNVVNTTGTGYTVGTLVANFEGNLAGTANAANALTTARTIAASGDATWSVSFDGSANVSSALTLANTGVTATNYGTSTAVPTIAVDSKGRITSASNTNIAFPVTSVNGAGGTVVLTTTNIAEGTNQYFTTGRVSAYLTGAISTVLTADLTASRAVASNASGKLVSSGTTDTELGYLSGVTSAVQTQLNSKLNLTGGTLTGGLSGTTGTFSGILTTPQVKAATSAGLSINANSGTQVADFGAGGSANITFFGGLAGTSATFSGALNATTLVKSGGTASQFLMADGSVNTSVLASGAYLPLAGGTLTGPLLGTSAKFNSYFGTDMGSGGIYFSGDGSPDIAYIGYNYTNLNGTEAVYQSARSSWRQHFGNGSTNSWKLAYRAPSAAASSWTDYFTIASTGAATFASFVGINGSPGTGFPLEAYINSSTAYTTSSRGNVMRVFNSNTSANIFAGIELGGAGTANDGLAGLNAVVTGSGSAALTFYTRDSNTFAEKLRITSGGNVGIGTTNPNNLLELSSATSGGSLRFSNSANTAFYWDIGRESVSTGDFLFRKASGGAASDYMRITNDGVIDLPFGQIKFPATQNASSNANTLDDYEEGTFTPTLGTGGGTSGFVYSTRSGSYTKIGNLVNIRVVITLTTLGGDNGNAYIYDLPFTNGQSTAVIGASVIASTTSTLSNPTILVSASSNYAQLEKNSLGAAITKADLTNTTTILFNATYRV
jgi:hypothetical protein